MLLKTTIRKHAENVHTQTAEITCSGKHRTEAIKILISCKKKKRQFDGNKLHGNGKLMYLDVPILKHSRVYYIENSKTIGQTV